MKLVLRQNMVSSSQFVPIDLATDRLDEQRPESPLSDIRVFSIAVPHRPDVLSCVAHVIRIISSGSPLIGWEANQIAWIFKSAVVESVQHLLRINLSATWMVCVVSITPNCIAKATPANRQPDRFPPEKVPLFLSLNMTS